MGADGRERLQSCCGQWQGSRRVRRERATSFAGVPQISQAAISTGSAQYKFVYFTASWSVQCLQCQELYASTLLGVACLCGLFIQRFKGSINDINEMSSSGIFGSTEVNAKCSVDLTLFIGEEVRKHCVGKGNDSQNPPDHIMEVMSWAILNYTRI